MSARDEPYSMYSMRRLVWAMVRQAYEDAVGHGNVLRRAEAWHWLTEFLNPTQGCLLRQMEAKKVEAEMGRKKTLTRRQWIQQVGAFGSDMGWASMYFNVNQGVDNALPNLILLRPPRVLFVACTVNKGREEGEKPHAFLDVLRSCGLQAHLWHPEDIPTILTCLAREEAT